MVISSPSGRNRLKIPSFIAMDVMRRATELEAEGRSILHLEVGQPGAPAPQAARDAVSAALGEPLGYTLALGTGAFREAVAALYERWYGLALDPARVIATTGSSGAFQLCFLSLFAPGDAVAVPDPSYPSYRNMLTALGYETVRMETGPDDGFQPTADQLRALAAERPIRGLLIASPANPTGSMLSRDRLSDLLDAAADLGIAVVSDEIYHGLTYGARGVSALELSDDVYVVNSLSKYFRMTGWRIGWMVTPEAAVDPIERLAQNLFICPPHVSQRAAIGALSEAAASELAPQVAVYEANRDALLRMAASSGFGPAAPCDGAFYAYLDVTPFLAASGGRDGDSMAWCARLLEEAGVATTPGRDFDPVRGDGFVRLSYAGANAHVMEAAERIAAFIEAG